MDTFYNRMRDIRKDNDKTQQQVADHLSIQRNQYQLYESGKRYIPIDLFIKFCEYFEVSADYILGLEKGLNWPRDFKKGGKTKQITNSAKYIFLLSIRTSWALRAIDVLLSLQTTFLGSLTENRYRDKIGVPLTAVLLCL